MTRLLLISFALAGLLLPSGCRQPGPAVPPNILLIIGDDISWNDIGCYGNSAVRTPHIDALAGSGIRSRICT